jgi:hypothetical protein
MEGHPRFQHGGIAQLQAHDAFASIWWADEADGNPVRLSLIAPYYLSTAKNALAISSLRLLMRAYSIPPPSSQGSLRPPRLIFLVGC